MTHFLVSMTKFNTPRDSNIVEQPKQDAYTLLSVIEEYIHNTLNYLKTQQSQSFFFRLLLHLDVQQQRFTDYLSLTASSCLFAVPSPLIELFCSLNPPLR